MFPDRITAGHILIVAGNAYVVTHRLPDAFVARSLDVASIVETFSFEELHETYVEGMLRIEPPRSASRRDEELEALWVVVCQKLDRLLANGSTSLTDASLTAVIPELMQAQVRYHERVGNGSPSNRGPASILCLSPHTLRRRLRRYRTHGAYSGLSCLRPVRDPLEAFDPAVAEMTWAAATMYVSANRPTVKALYHELMCRLASLPERHMLRVPSLSTFHRIVARLPRDMVDNARHGAVKAGSPTGEAA